MRIPHGSVRRTFAKACLVGVAILLVAVLLAAAGCAEQHAVPQPRQRAASLAEVQTAFDAAAQAVLEGDRAAFDAAVEADGDDGRRALRQLYRRLAPLPWRGFAFHPAPVHEERGRYLVQAAGQLGPVGPPDRLAAERVLDVEWRDGAVVVVGDETPPDVRRQHLMAFNSPMVVRRNGLLIVADGASRRRAEALGAAGGEARTRLGLLGITPREPVFVALYSSSSQLRAALGGGPSEKRIKFFSVAAPRLEPEAWAVRDVGVLGPMLEGTGAWMPRMLAHEMTHAYTVRWFSRTRHAPTLLLEGLATAAEGGRDFAPLHAELAAGNQLWPLEEALAVVDLWAGNSTEQVRLAYLEGASVVLYVIDGWGLPRLKPFLVAVADSDLSREGLDAATRETLGVSWPQFERGWRRYVERLTSVR